MPSGALQPKLGASPRARGQQKTITSEAKLNHAKVSEANKNKNTATASKDDDAFALAGRIFLLLCPQGVALG